LAIEAHFLQVCMTSITSQEVVNTWYSSLSTNFVFVALVGWDQVRPDLVYKSCKNVATCRRKLGLEDS
jgi:hypothetical protein